MISLSDTMTERLANFLVSAQSMFEICVNVTNCALPALVAAWSFCGAICKNTSTKTSAEAASANDENRTRKRRAVLR